MRYIYTIPTDPQAANRRDVLYIRLLPPKPYEKTAVIVMKHPSKANAFRDDPTMVHVKEWAVRHGFAQIYIVNLFDALVPNGEKQSLRGLRHLPFREAVGESDYWIGWATSKLSVVVILAWGGPEGLNKRRKHQDERWGQDDYWRRVRHVLGFLVDFGIPLHYVGECNKTPFAPLHGLKWEPYMPLKKYPPLTQAHLVDECERLVNGRTWHWAEDVQEQQKSS